MWKCHKCGKPVYFAERKQSLGYDWHPECLRCEECGKRLNPGQHAEHKGVPYCHVPCYGALFGPQLYGHGTRVESHTSFGKVENKSSSKNMPRSHLESKLKVFNQYYDGKSGEIRCREVNGRLVLEGSLRIHWGVSGVIHLKEDVDQRTVVTVRKRNSYRYSGIGINGVGLNGVGLNGFQDKYENGKSQPEENKVLDIPDPTQNLAGKSLTLPSKLDLNKIDWNELDELLQVERKVEDGEKLYQTMPSSLPSGILGSPPPSSDVSPLTPDTSPLSSEQQAPLTPEEKQNGDDYSRCFEDTLEMGMSIDRSQSNPEALSQGAGSGCESENETRSEARAVRRRAPIVRRNGARRRRLKRRCSINGHFYNRETSFFTPPYGSQMSVWVTSLVSTNEVINLMLDKYKVDSSADCFALYVVRDNGEQRMLKDDEYPLVTRVMLGPHEDVARLYLMDKKNTVEISSEVAQFLNLSLPECTAILDRYEWEEQREERKIVSKYKEMRKRIKQRMEELSVRL